MLAVEPLVSVIIPVRDGMPHLRECVESAAGQTWRSTEVIVVDDGSTDGSVEWVHGCHLANVRVISGPGTGACAARNAGLEVSNGDFIQFLDADDFLAHDKVELQLRLLLTAASPTSTVSYSQLKQFRDGTDPAGGQIWHSAPRSFEQPLDLLADILQTGNFIQTGQWLIPRQIADRVGRWDDSLRADQDGDYFSRVLACGDFCVACPEAVAFYRRSNTGRQISAGKTKQHFESRLHALERKLVLLRECCDVPTMTNIVSRQCTQLAFSSYPASVEVTNRCLKLLKSHSVGFVPDFPTALLRLISRILGWRVARYCSFIKHRGDG